jgi:Xaa-Pro aminopeptidase
MSTFQIFKKELKKNSLDGFIFSTPQNITYLTDTVNPDAYLLASLKGLTYFTDSRYIEDIRLKLKSRVDLKKINGSAFRIIAQSCIDLALQRVGFEERYLPYAEFKKIKEYLKGKVHLIPSYGIIENMRALKNNAEIAKIKKAIKITACALGFIQDFIRPGVREIEIAAELERYIRYQGATGPAFGIIVASGTNSAYPHHVPTGRKLANDDVVLIDIGVDYLGYKSDLTRVYFLGKINSLARRIYAILLKAQENAIRMIKAGESVSRVDAVSRNYIISKGYGRNFVHSLGHGVGLDIHEAPSVSGKSEDILEEGMVFTVEPGIYLPGKFGIRIEDMVLVTKKGCEVLSGSVNK